MSHAKRVVFLGLDAMVPNMVERFLAEGILPHFEELLKRGILTRICPAIPAQTPSNWNTLATGATPGTHGVVQWGSHIPGEPVWEYHREDAFTAGLCRAEYLWEAAARQGVRSVVMNYAGYPPTTESAVFIDWLFQPYRSYFDLTAPTVYHNCPELDTTDPIELTPANDWAELPPSRQPALEAQLPVVTATEGDGPTYYALAWSREGIYDTLLIAPTRNASRPGVTLTVGDWSNWVRAQFRTVDQGEAEGAFRFKLLELAPEGQRLRLYRTDAFPTDGRFCSDPDLGKQLVRHLGPYIHAGMSCNLHTRDWVNWETVDELMWEEAQWWSGAAELAMGTTGASLLVLHWHILDTMGHHFVPLVDPTGTEYDLARAPIYWEVIRNYYRSADRFVGAFAERFDDGETVFAVVSDHGMPANKKAVSLVNLFKHRGWVTLKPDGQDVDWTQSKVFFAQNHLWVNLRDRDEGGIVPAGQYRALRSEVLAAMRELRDPETGEHVFAFVLTREDAPMVGLWGDYIGDLVYCYNGGYRWSGTQVLRMEEERVVFPSGGGNHGPMIPTYETDTTSNLGGMVLAGPGIRAGEKLAKQLQSRVRTTDLAPTLAYLLGIDAPAQNEGRVLREFLSDFACARPIRTVQSTGRPIRRRPTLKPPAVVLQGDVTDEG